MQKLHLGDANKERHGLRFERYDRFERFERRDGAASSLGEPAMRCKPLQAAAAEEGLMNGWVGWIDYIGWIDC